MSYFLAPLFVAREEATAVDKDNHRLVGLLAGWDIDIKLVSLFWTIDFVPYTLYILGKLWVKGGICVSPFLEGWGQRGGPFICLVAFCRWATHHVVGWPECDGSGSNCTAYGIHDMVLAPMMLCWTYAPLVYFV